MIPANRCDTCRVLSTTDCPILDIAVRFGLDGMEKCEMAETVEKVYMSGVQAGILGKIGKNKRKS